MARSPRWRSTSRSFRRRDGWRSSRASKTDVSPAARLPAQLERARLLLANQIEIHLTRAILVGARDDLPHFHNALHRLPFDTDDDVPLLEPRLVRRRAVRHPDDEDARLQAKAPLDSVGDRHELRAGHAARRELEWTRQPCYDRS